MKNSKYINQPCDFSCGPTAVYNAYVWKYNDVVDFNSVLTITKFSPFTGGIPALHLGNSLKAFSIEYYTKRCPSVAYIDKKLSEGAAIILQYIKPKDGSGHYSLIIKHKDKTLLVNHARTKKYSKVNLDALLRIKKWGAPIAFVIQ